MNKQDIYDSIKSQLDIHINILLDQGERRANIEIELLHAIKKIIYK